MPELGILIFRAVQGVFSGIGMASAILWFTYKKHTKSCKFCGYRKPKAKLNDKGVCLTCAKNVELASEVSNLKTQLRYYDMISQQIVEKEREKIRKEELEKDYIKEEGIREEDLSDIMAELRGM